MSDIKNTYRIEHVRDFLNVPEYRRSACIEEFAIFLKMAEASVNLIDATNEVLFGKGLPKTVIGAFTWIDDGKKNAYLNIIDASKP